MEPPPSSHAIRNNGCIERPLGRRDPDSRRNLSADSVEESMFDALSKSAWVLDDKLERRQSWRGENGFTAWDLLSRLLLGVDVCPVCGGRDEPALGRRPYESRPT